MNLNKFAQVAYFLLRVVSGLLIFQAGSMIPKSASNAWPPIQV